MNASMLPTDDANFLSHALDLFDASESTIEFEGAALDKSALVTQVKGKLYQKDIPYKGADIITLDAALSFYLRYVADSEGKIEVAERLKSDTEKMLDQLL